MWSWFNDHKYFLFQKRIKINSRCEGYISVFLNYFFQDKYFSSRFEIKDLEVFLPFFLTYFRYLNSLNEFARTISSKKFFQFLLIEIRSWKKFQLTVSWISWKLTLVKLISMVKRERERERVRLFPRCMLGTTTFRFNDVKIQYWNDKLQQQYGGESRIH